MLTLGRGVELAMHSAVVAASVAVVVVVTLALRHRAQAAQRLAELVATAEPSLAECRRWKTDVEQGIADAVSAGRWIPREALYAWLAVRPAPPPEVKKLAEQAMANAKSEIDLAAATSEFATMAAQLAAIQKLRKK